MSRCARIGLWLTACLLPGSLAVAEEPAARPMAVIEFRWLESACIKDRTEQEGFRTTCGDELSYAHLKPVLTNPDVAEARLNTYDFTANGLPGKHYMVELHLTPQARRKLIDSLGGQPTGVLAVFVDGNYWGAWNFQSSTADKFLPHAGFLTNLGEAQRIVDAVERK